jgi:hypothetical protein
MKVRCSSAYKNEVIDKAVTLRGGKFLLLYWNFAQLGDTWVLIKVSHITKRF